MIEPDVLAAALVTVIIALSGATLAIMRQQTAGRIEVLKATALLAEKIAIVEHQTNSIATRDAGIIAGQAREIAMYKEQLTIDRQTALLLAQSKAVNALDTMTGTTLMEHDAWEKGERAVTAASLAENTALTRAIHDAVVPKVKP